MTRSQLAALVSILAPEGEPQRQVRVAVFQVTLGGSWRWEPQSATPVPPTSLTLKDLAVSDFSGQNPTKARFYYGTGHIPKSLAELNKKHYVDLPLDQTKYPNPVPIQPDTSGYCFAICWIVGSIGPEWFGYEWQVPAAVTNAGGLYEDFCPMKLVGPS